MKYTIKNYYRNIFLLYILSFGIKLLLFFIEFKYGLLSDFFKVYFRWMYIILDIGIWIIFLQWLRRIISRDRVIFDFLESALIILTVLSNFYISIIAASYYFQVFSSDASLGTILITILTFVNGNATYTSVFDGSKFFFSVVSILSYLILVLIIGILQSALSSNGTDMDDGL